VACIGPAGERGVLFASIINDRDRAAGRSGASGVAHEINNPLGVIQCYANLIAKSQPSDPQVLVRGSAVAHGLKECRYIDVVRFGGPLFFANASYLEDQIRHRRKMKKALMSIRLSGLR